MANAKPGDHAFGASKPFSVGAEEELFLVDPVSGRMVNSSAAITEKLAPTIDGVDRELHAGMIELITGVCSNTGEVISETGATARGVRRYRRGASGVRYAPDRDGG